MGPGPVQVQEAGLSLLCTDWELSVWWNPVQKERPGEQRPCDIARPTLLNSRNQRCHRGHRTVCCNHGKDLTFVSVKNVASMRVKKYILHLEGFPRNKFVCPQNFLTWAGLQTLWRLRTPLSLSELSPMFTHSISPHQFDFCAMFNSLSRVQGAFPCFKVETTYRSGTEIPAHKKKGAWRPVLLPKSTISVNLRNGNVNFRFC